MIEILRIVIRVFIANRIRRVRQQTRRSQQPLIDRVEINERFQRRTTTARLRSAVDLGLGVILRANHRANRAGVVFHNDHCRLRNVVTIQRRQMRTKKRSSCLQIEIERCAHRTAQFWILRDHRIDKMRRKVRRIEARLSVAARATIADRA